MSSRRVRAVLRKEALHFTVGTAVGLALLFVPYDAMRVILGALAALMVVFEIARAAVPAFNHWAMKWLNLIVRKGEEARWTGATYFLIASAITALVFPRHIAAPAVLFLGVGDSTATIIGVWKGKIKLSHRSLEGHLACFTVCLAIGIILSYVLPELTPAVAICGAVAATLFQAFDWPINDNIVIPVGSAAVMAIVSWLTM